MEDNMDSKTEDKMDENIEETEDIMEDLLKEDSEISATEGVLVLEVQV